MKKLLLLIILTSLLSTAEAATWYVNRNASGLNNGTSWANAYTDLQNAITSSSFGDEIWVASGTYFTTQTTSRTIYFTIKNGTKLYGGFNGTESTLSERNVSQNTTILSAEIGAGTSSDNSYHVIRFNSVGNQTRVDGFTITGAYNSYDYGGAIVSVASSPTIANCIIAGNFATEGGGALNHSTSGVFTIDNCIFDGNVGNTYGGGALRLYAGTINISNSYFKSNQSNTYGGAIFIYGALVNIDKSVFAGNISNSSGSAIRIGDTGTLNLSNSLVVGNYTNATDAINSSTFSNTSAHKIRNCTIAHNKQENQNSSTYPSTVALNDEATITNSIIYGNNFPIQVLNTGLNFNHNITQSAQSGANGTNVLHVNPQFVLPGDVNNAPFDTTGLNYQLSILSPGIDYGLNSNVFGSTDLNNVTRIQNTNVDLGAYESGFCTSTASFSPTAPHSICGGNPITLTVNEGVHFLWSDGSFNNTLTVSTPGSISVTFEDANGCRGVLQTTVVGASNPTPIISLAAGQLSTQSFATYQWSYNGSLIPGATNQTHPPLQGYGTYSVAVENSNGCSGNATYCFSPATITTSGPTTFCEGNSVDLTIINGTNQIWSTNSIDPTITVTSSGNYTATVFNATANCTITLQQSVVVHPTPEPTIQLTGANLKTQTFASYQWYLNGTIINGATNQEYTPTQNGQYTVQVISFDGCNGNSSEYNLTNLSADYLSKSRFEIYPNPVNNDRLIYFNWDNEKASKGTILVTDYKGSIVYRSEFNGLPSSLLLPELATGVYFLSIQLEDQSSYFITNKIIVR